MHRNRIIYGSVLLITSILTYKVPSYIFSVTLYILLLIPIVSLAVLYFTYAHLRIVSSVNKRMIVKGDKVDYTITLQNRSPFVYCPLELKLTGDRILFKKQYVPSLSILYPMSSKEIIIPLECRYRGNYHIGVASITFRDFFNLFKIKYKKIETHQILVYPNVKDLKYLPIKNRIVEDTNIVKGYFNEEHDQFKDIRSYEYGDSINRIHWKLSAKYNEMMVKAYQVAVNNASLLFLDITEHHYFYEINIALEDKIIETAVHMIHYMLKRNMSCKLMYYHLSSVALEGHQFSDFERFYQALAPVQFGHSMDFGLYISKMMDQLQIRDELDSYHNLMIITSHITKELYASLTHQKCKKMNVTLLYISPADLIKVEQTTSKEIIESLKTSGVEIIYIEVDRSS